MPRTPLPIGTWGEISTRTLKTTKNRNPVKHLAHARFRDHDGKVRAVNATGATKTAVRTALLAKLQSRAKTNHSGDQCECFLRPGRQPHQVDRCQRTSRHPRPNSRGAPHLATEVRSLTVPYA
jgi:hypothetical protein